MPKFVCKIWSFPFFCTQKVPYFGALVDDCFKVFFNLNSHYIRQITILYPYTERGLQGVVSEWIGIDTTHIFPRCCFSGVAELLTSLCSCSTWWNNLWLCRLMILTAGWGMALVRRLCWPPGSGSVVTKDILRSAVSHMRRDRHSHILIFTHINSLLELWDFGGWFNGMLTRVVTIPEYWKTPVKIKQQQLLLLSTKKKKQLVGTKIVKVVIFGFCKLCWYINNDKTYADQHLTGC